MRVYSQYMKRLNINLTDDEHKRFKLVCVEQDADMSDVIRKLIEGYVKSQKAKSKRRKH